VVKRVADATGALKRDQTNVSVANTTDRRPPRNKGAVTLVVRTAIRTAVRTVGVFDDRPDGRSDRLPFC